MYSAVNTGNTTVSLVNKTNVNNLLNNEKTSIRETSTIIAPGSNTTQSITIGNLSYGIYEIDANIDVYSIGDSLSDKKYLETITQNLRIINFPIKEALLLFSLLALFILYLLSKHLLHRRALKHATPYTVGANEDIVGLGEKFNLNWKKLAKFNKLKIPYLLHPGDTLLIPPHHQIKNKK
jgi:hypothetical protein